jgi:STE24 endopeptidase
VKFWLASRQVRHVARHREQVPAPFSSTVSLSAHQKAADYTITKARIGLLETAFASAVLLGWTLLGGLDALNRALVQWLGTGMLQQLVLLAAFRRHQRPGGPAVLAVPDLRGRRTLRLSTR